MQNENLEKITHQWGLTHVQALPHDASTRLYYRADQGILMADHESGHEERIGNFKSIAERLKKHGLRAPEIYNIDDETGFALIEDFGGISLKDAPSQENLKQAYVLLDALRNVDSEGLNIYSEAIYQEELSRLWRFYLRALGIDDNELASLAQDSLQELATKSDSFVHLDYHGENLMILPGGEIGLLDIQDARQGHKLYDLASFFDGIRMPMPEDLLAQALAPLSLDDRHDYHILSAQRLIKVIGIFARLYGAGQAKYGALLPNVFENLDRHFEYDQLRLWREWFYDVVPRPTAETLKKLEQPHDPN